MGRRLTRRARRAAGTPMRVPSYDVCHEGLAFHAGLVPVNGRASPRCAEGTWALLDDIGRFTGSLQVLDEAACERGSSGTPGSG